MEIKNIKKELSRFCDFTEEWNHMAPAEGSEASCIKYPSSEIGFVRCDHDGHRWHTAPVKIRSSIYTRERARELDTVVNALTREFKSLSALEEFCAENAEDLRSGYEYNLYYSGELCNYWIRVNTLRRNYNLYIHAMIKH